MTVAAIGRTREGVSYIACHIHKLPNAMFTVSSILVPTDFSENAQKALALAKELARGTNATLHVVHVVEPVVYPADWGYAQVGFADLERELEVSTQKELNTLADTLQKEGYKVETKVLRGRASEEICAYAKDHGASIIAIGTHGRGGLEHFLFGSTTERVLRKAPCPVLSVRLDQ
ncbi:MAG: universal stress protein [Candidatus Kapabacteria bacterium]|nr:universal stress protein [Candidatus Kapabacteria bacterium]